MHQWNEVTNRSNPSRSSVLIALIKKVKKFEIRGQGMQPKARWPMNAAEFRAVTGECCRFDESNIVGWYGIPAFQFHMIGHVDDWAKFHRENLAAHEIHAEKCAKACIAWSKNVNEERDAP